MLFLPLVRIVLPAWMAFLFLCPLGHAQPSERRFLGFPMDRSMRLSGLSVPLSPDGKNNLGRVVFENVSIRPKSFGGLQIGVLPELLVEGLRVEIPPGDQSAEWAANLRAVLQREPLLRSARFSGFSIRDFSGTDILQAERAKIGEGCALISLEGVRMGKARIPSGTISLRGAQAGHWLCGRSSTLLIDSSKIPN